MFGLSSTTISEVKSGLEARKTVHKEAYEEKQLISIVVDTTCDRELICLIRDNFIPQTPAVKVEVMDIHEFQLDNEFQARDLAIILAGENRELTASVASGFSEGNIDCAIITTDDQFIPESSLVDSHEQAPVRLIFHERPQVCLEKLIRWLLATTDNKLGLGVAFPVLRSYACDMMIKGCATENAAIALVPFLNSSDTALMTANQIKLCVGMAALYNKDISLKLAPEVGFVIAASYGYRSIARGLPETSAVVERGLKAALGAGGTYLTGVVLQNFYRISKNINIDIPNI